ncbi:MAG: protein kinase domain-containing protein, partial [Oceanococcaceae bacterium]
MLDQRLQTRPANELWRIRHVQSGQFRVVKLALDERAQRALKREVTLNKVLRAELGDDAPLVPLLEWQFETSPAWIQMPWYEMGSLADWMLAIGGPQALALTKRLRIVADAAEALAKAHGLGVMHKDIKPGNFMIELEAGEARLLMCDFGSGTVKSRERLEQSGVTVMGFTKSVHIDSSTSGTPAYMAPEVLKGGVFSEQSDVFALGVLLYQLVIGDLTEPMAPGWEEDVTDSSLRDIIAEACAGKPARRIADMATLAQRIRAWTPGQATGSASPDLVVTESKSERPRSRHRPVRTAALGVLLLLAAVWLWRNIHVTIIADDDVADASTPAASNDQRVAILAFDLLGLDGQTQTVMGGLQDALIADLANLSGIRLVHGQNLTRLGLDNAPARQIGRALKADQLIRGSVQQSGEQLRVNLQIVDATRNEATWGQAVQGTRSNLFSMQADIAKALTTALGRHHAPSGGQTVNNQAYEAYLAALSLWNQGDVHGEALSTEIERALELDPDFIDAQLLALLIAAREYWSSASPRDESESRIAQHLAALERLDTPPVKLATARAVWRYYLEHDPAGGLEILAPFRRQLVRNTESALFYAYMLRRVGRVDEAYSILDQVMDQDPSATVPLETKAEMLALQGKGGAAITLLQQVVALEPKHGMAKIRMAGYSYKLTGELGFLQLGREILAQSEHYKDMAFFADLEMARRRGDLTAIRELARAFDSEDKTSSGHGREPWELGVAWALYVGQAPIEEV